MFSGEKCIRCKKHFKFEELQPGPDGFSVCGNCAARIRSIHEQKMLCPNDGQEMRKVFAKHFLIAVCAKCGGVWINNYELELIKRESAVSYSRYYAIELISTILEAADKESGNYR